VCRRQDLDRSTPLRRRAVPPLAASYGPGAHRPPSREGLASCATFLSSYRRELVPNAIPLRWPAQAAWHHAPLIWSICRSHRLDAADAEDAAQNVWLQLVDHLDRLRDPAALPSWLATTTGANAATSRAARRPCDGGYAPTARTIPTITPRRLSRTCPQPNGTRRCGRRSGSCPRAASRCSPRSLRIRRCRTRRSEPAGHPGRQHRAESPPLRGQAAPPPGHHRADQRRYPDRHARGMAAVNEGAPSPSRTSQPQSRTKTR
jgi:Sigma-70 region 2